MRPLVRRLSAAESASNRIVDEAVDFLHVQDQVFDAHVEDAPEFMVERSPEKLQDTVPLPHGNDLKLTFNALQDFKHFYLGGSPGQAVASLRAAMALYKPGLFQGHE